MTRATVFFSDKSNLRFEQKLLHQSQIPECDLSDSKTLKTLCRSLGKGKLFGELFLAGGF
jgi:hypothetical protein